MTTLALTWFVANLFDPTPRVSLPVHATMEYSQGQYLRFEVSYWPAGNRWFPESAVRVTIHALTVNANIEICRWDNLPANARNVGLGLPNVGFRYYYMGIILMWWKDDPRPPDPRTNIYRRVTFLSIVGFPQ
jgi:hypothetical protein